MTRKGTVEKTLNRAGATHYEKGRSRPRPESLGAVFCPRPASPPTPVVFITPAREGSDVQEPRNANL